MKTGGPEFLGETLDAGPRPVAPAATDGQAPILRVRGLCKEFSLRSGGLFKKVVGTVRAVQDVDFDLHPGETLGLVGESGSGKTTTVRCLLQALRPTAGAVHLRVGDRTWNLATLSARELRPLRQHMQMIFQDPFASLNPRLTVGQIVGEPLVIHRLARGREIVDRVERMLLRVGLHPSDRQRYPHAFSGGQRQRIAIARALIMQPSLVIADEAVSALDLSVQAQVINLLRDLQQELQLTYVLVAHDLSVVRHICDRVAVMYAGRIVELAPTEAIFEDPRHPYTRMLLSAVPSADPDVPMNFDLHGEAADPARLPEGCSFHPRCESCFAPCLKSLPAMRALEGGRSVACHLYGSAEAQPAV